MSVRELSGTTAVVTGASRGFGRVTAMSFAALGVQVVGVARSEKALNEMKEELGAAFIPEVADVTDPSLPTRLLSVYQPRTLVLNAGAIPTLDENERRQFAALAGRLLVGLMRAPGAVRWTCRLCDLDACGRPEGRCPLEQEARRRYG